MLATGGYEAPFSVIEMTLEERAAWLTRANVGVKVVTQERICEVNTRPVLKPIEVHGIVRAAKKVFGVLVETL